MSTLLSPVPGVQSLRSGSGPRTPRDRDRSVEGRHSEPENGLTGRPS